MGIKDLNTFLLKSAPECFSSLSISDLNNYAIAIDSVLLLHAYIAAAQKEIIMKTPDPLQQIERMAVLEYTKEKILSFIEKFSIYGVTLVWIWDGEAVPDKIKAHERRTKQKTSINDKISQLKEELLAMHPLSRDAKKLSELKSLLVQKVSVSSDEKLLFKNFLTSLGFPCFVAATEAEVLCASLAREGKVAGVWSTDTDNFPLGTPMLLTGFDGYTPEKHPKINISYPSVALSRLNLTVTEFIDFCIMLECDFNERMPNIGPIKAQKLINQYRNIDQIAVYRSDLPVDKLNHHKCRECFQHLPSNISMEELQLNLQAPVLNSYPTLFKLFSTIPKPRTVSFT